MKKLVFSIALTLCALSIQAKDYTLSSPDGKLKMEISAGASTQWSLSVCGETVSAGNTIRMDLADGRSFGQDAKVVKAIKTSGSETVRSPFYRQSSFETSYNSLTLSMKGRWGLEFRAYDEGVAYRFVTSCADSLSIRNETVEFHHEGDLIIPFSRKKDDIFETSFESQYTFFKDGDAINREQVAFLPILSDPKKNVGKILLMEADVENYPGMFIQQGEHILTALFPPVPTAFVHSNRWADRPAAYGDIIARTAGSRSFPWRIAAYGAQDRDFPTNNLVYALAEPSRVADIDWITPGLSSWDWWNNFTLTGVDFKAGINTDLYKYHVDFAAEYGLQYILLDEGWYKCPDIMHPLPEVNVAEICRYAAGKGVKVVLWSTAGLVDKDLENVFEHYAAMGVSGFKLDFMDAQDQKAVQQLYRIAECAARHRLVIDYHGMYKPTGMHRTYPNVLNFEGVYGLEQMSKPDLDMPLNDVTIPYIRMAAGQMDYTPGGMRNAGRKEPVIFKRGGYVQGTRAHQVAEYVVFDQPFGMLSDSPSRYMAEPQTTRFIAAVPTVFDRTFVQSGTVGKNIVTVRNAADRWFVGGLTSWDESDVVVDFSFLPEGRWNAEFFHDGVNSNKTAIDYKIEKLTVDSTTKLPVHMCSGGGFAIILSK